MLSILAYARRSRLLFILLLALPIFMAGGHAVRANWLFSYPPNMVNLDSGKRNNVFYAGDSIKFTLSIANYGTYALQGAVRYEVRDYWGNVVDQGTTPAPTPTTSPPLTVRVTQPGWYKLYLHQTAAQAPWGDSVGGTMFVIFRPNPSFPVMPSPLLPGNSGVFDGDEVARGVTAMGPQRHPVADASQPDQAIAQLDPSIALDKQYYTSPPFSDPQRARPLLIAFPNGVGSSDPAQQGKNLAGLRQLVAHYHGDVKYWEPLNEPNNQYSGADYVNKELKPFYQTVKGVDPTCKVLGPAIVTIGPYGLSWIEDFLKAGGANYIDAFSFHAYNNVNGDLTLARQSLDALQALLTKYGCGNIEKWQTEQGYFAACYGAYEPRLQGRWTMLQMMVYEQYGIPKEHNHLWYDKSHGFWDFPAFWENEDGPYASGSFDPAAPLMRVWGEELYGASFQKAYDFGALGNKMYVGSLFGGPGKQVAAFMSAGRTDGQVTLGVTGGASVHVVSAFGVAQDLPLAAGRVTLPVPELPVYVELAPGQSLQVVPTDYGPDLALTPGTTASASGSPSSPLDPSYPNDPAKIINGALENWYWNQGPGDHPWMSNTAGFPATVQVTLPQPMTINHVVVYAGVPWQNDGSLLDYELQYDSSGQWVTLSHVQEPPVVVPFFTPTVFTTVDSFYSDRCVFQHDFPAVTTQKIRLLVHDTTWGGGATQNVVQAGGQTGPHQITLREIELYGPAGQTVPVPTGKVRFFPRLTCAGRMVGGRFQGSQDGVIYTDLYKITSAPPDGQWTEAALYTDLKAFRFLRYLSPDGSYGNIAELEFYSGTGANAVKLTGTPFGTPGSYYNSGSTFSKVFDGDTTTCFDAPGPSGNFAGIDQGTSGPAPTVTGVSVTPPAATVGGGQIQQFSAAVSGTGGPSQAVTWAASAGSVNGAGLFTAPAATAGVQTITVTATSTADGTKSAAATVTVPAAPPTVTGVSVTPPTATVGGGQTQQFSATVSGTGNPSQAVTWMASAGSVTATGLFTAPAAMSGAQTVTVTATSAADPTKSARATVTVPAAVSAGGTGKVRFFPRAGCADRMLGGRFQGSTDGVTYTDLYTITSIPADGQWTEAALTTDPKAYRFLRYLSPDGGWGNVSEVGFYSGAGAGAVKLTGTPFGSPGSYYNNGNTFSKVFDGDTTTCFDAPGPNGNFAGIDQSGMPPTVMVTGVSVTPPAATVGGGQIQQFSAAVSGTGGPSQAVTWAASAGSVNGAGLFTAPAATAGAQTVTVTATSAADPTKSARATVTVAPDPVYRINVGGGASGPFAADGYVGGGNTYTAAAPVSTAGVTNAAPPSVYQSERWGSFTYTLPGLTPGASYHLRLHFAEIFWNSAGMRVFNVAANGQPLLTGFDIFAVAGGMNKAVVRDFTVTADSGGKVTLAFAAAPGSPDPNAKASGLELWR